MDETQHAVAIARRAPVLDRLDISRIICAIAGSAILIVAVILAISVWVLLLPPPPLPVPNVTK